MPRQRKSVLRSSPAEAGCVQCFSFIPVWSFCNFHERIIHRSAVTISLHRFDLHSEAVPGSVHQESLRNPIRNVGLFHSRKSNRNLCREEAMHSSTIVIDPRMWLEEWFSECFLLTSLSDCSTRPREWSSEWSRTNRSWDSVITFQMSPNRSSMCILLYLNQSQLLCSICLLTNPRFRHVTSLSMH